MHRPFRGRGNRHFLLPSHRDVKKEKRMQSKAFKHHVHQRDTKDSCRSAVMPILSGLTNMADPSRTRGSTIIELATSLGESDRPPAVVRRSCAERGLTRRGDQGHSGEARSSTPPCRGTKAGCERSTRKRGGTSYPFVQRHGKDRGGRSRRATTTASLGTSRSPIAPP